MIFMLLCVMNFEHVVLFCVEFLKHDFCLCMVIILSDVKEGIIVLLY